MVPLPLSSLRKQGPTDEQPRCSTSICCPADHSGRVWEHKVKAVPGFTAKYGVDRLVWYEQHASLEAAFARERQLKKWKRAWKIQLIEADNPQWLDLYPGIAL